MENLVESITRYFASREDFDEKKAIQNIRENITDIKSEIGMHQITSFLLITQATLTAILEKEKANSITTSIPKIPEIKEEKTSLGIKKPLFIKTEPVKKQEKQVYEFQDE